MSVYECSCRSFSASQVKLLPGLFRNRFDLIHRYVKSLRPENLLQSHYLEAGLGSYSQLRNTTMGQSDTGDERHWGWESPTCQVRGQFLGHWLSASCRIATQTGDRELAARADAVVEELGKCQAKNGGEWVFSIPEKYLHWIAEGHETWAPHYVTHKTLMGLQEMHAISGNALSLDIFNNAARWFYRWSKGFTREKMDDILDFETGGMLETWAHAYQNTGMDLYKSLIERYTRRRLFDRLLAGEDALTNMHANTTIPEAHGAAAAYEATGDTRWRRIVEKYWQCAVDKRGAFCTGGQTSGEIWTPPFAFAARLSDKNQEHCTVYNMIRLADYLFRWTGKSQYADYIERNLYNGILAQQNPSSGMVAYFLPLQAGAKKVWGTPTYDFWCCHGTLVQAHALLNTLIFYRDDSSITLCQYIASKATADISGSSVSIELSKDERVRGQSLPSNRPASWTFNLRISCKKPAGFAVRLRIPWWVEGKAAIEINGKKISWRKDSDGFVSIKRPWHNDTIRIELPKRLSMSEIPDEPSTAAFMEGPMVLAGLCDCERTISARPRGAASMLAPDNERQWGNWLGGWRLKGQCEGMRFKPLHEIVDERYTVYFPIV